jgi:D-glycerate 3-kinase
MHCRHFVESWEMDRKDFDELALSMRVQDPGYYDAIQAIAAKITERIQKAPFIVEVSGAQGSGKSTLANLLVGVLQEVDGLKAGALSLDDFYKTRETRQKLAADSHPLFAVRGVPGTHDVALLNRVLESVRDRRTTKHPVFNKAEDDRDARWQTLESLDVLVLEGWCLGALPQPESLLEIPVNELEAVKDPGASWRRKVNGELASGEYRQAFDCDMRIFLAVPDMDSVLKWRLQQEQDLPPGAEVMDEGAIREFIMYFERITRAMLGDLPKRSDITIFLNEEHKILEYR